MHSSTIATWSFSDLSLSFSMIFTARGWTWWTADGGVPLTTTLYTARAGNGHFGLLIAPRAHTNAPCKAYLLWKTVRACNRPGGAAEPSPNEPSPSLVIGRAAWPRASSWAMWS